MTSKLKKRAAFLLCIAFVVGGICTFYVRTHPLVFNESFWGHAHCIVGGGLSLRVYAGEHHGKFPYHTNGYGDALLLVNDGWDASLTGPGYDTRVFKRARRTGEDAPENEFGRVYVQGLSDTDSAEIAILFDKLPTPGGDHCHGFSRVGRPLAREVWTIGSDRRVIQESEWPAYSRRQVDLLIAAGIAPEQAARYYSERPKK
jgi:hypothetical protein